MAFDLHVFFSRLASIDWLKRQGRGTIPSSPYIWGNWTRVDKRKENLGDEQI